MYNDLNQITELLKGVVKADESHCSRIIKISQSSVMTYRDVVDYVRAYILSGRGSMEDALCDIERRYNIGAGASSVMDNPENT